MVFFFIELTIFNVSIQTHYSSMAYVHSHPITSYVYNIIRDNNNLYNISKAQFQFEIK